MQLLMMMMMMMMTMMMMIMMMMKEFRGVPVEKKWAESSGPWVPCRDGFGPTTFLQTYCSFTDFSGQ